jgi:hypothetical protein
MNFYCVLVNLLLLFIPVYTYLQIQINFEPVLQLFPFAAAVSEAAGGGPEHQKEPL